MYVYYTRIPVYNPKVRRVTARATHTTRKHKKNLRYERDVSCFTYVKQDLESLRYVKRIYSCVFELFLSHCERIIYIWEREKERDLSFLETLKSTMRHRECILHWFVCALLLSLIIRTKDGEKVQRGLSPVSFYDTRRPILSLLFMQLCVPPAFQREERTYRISHVWLSYTHIHGLRMIGKSMEVQPVATFIHYLYSPFLSSCRELHLNGNQF